MVELKLFTATFTAAVELRQLWDEVPNVACGYALNLKQFTWYPEVQRGMPIGQIHEARFFWQGGEASWRTYQIFDGQRHSHHYRAVLISKKEAVPGFQLQNATYKDKPKTELMLFNAMMDKKQSGPIADDRPAILTQAWHDADDQPLYWQWLEVVAGKVITLTDGGES